MLLVLTRVVYPAYVWYVIWGPLSSFLFFSALAFASSSCCIILLNFLVILFRISRFSSLTLYSWVLPVEVESIYKSFSAKYWPKIDSFPSVRPDAAYSVSGWYIYNPQGEGDRGGGYWLLVFGVSFLISWSDCHMYMFHHPLPVIWHRPLWDHQHLRLSVFWFLFPLDNFLDRQLWDLFLR